MILQSIGAALCIYGIRKAYYIGYPEKLIKKKWDSIINAQGKKNKQDKSFKVYKAYEKSYGYDLLINIPLGLGYEDLEKLEDVIKTNYNCMVDMEWLEGKGKALIKLITKPLDSLNYEPIETKPNELYLGYNHEKHITVDMNTFPNVLDSGCIGSGKSRLVLIILTNLINQHQNVDIYLTQIAKNDLYVFRNCRQVKGYAEDLKTTYNMLQKLYNSMNERLKIIKKLMDKGIYNIEEYNTRYKSNPLNYIYLVADEFSFYMPSEADDNITAELKRKCHALLQNFILLGRSIGLFVILSLQRPDCNNLSPLFKSQLNTRVAFRQLNEVSSRIVIDCDEAVNLPQREAILVTNEKTRIKTPYINDKIIKQYISSSIVKEKPLELVNVEVQQEQNVIPIGQLPKGKKKAIQKGVIKNVSSKG